MYMDAVPLHAVRNMDRESLGGQSEASISGKKEPEDGKDGAENQAARATAAANDEQKQQEDPRESLLGKDDTQTKEEKQRSKGGQATGSSDGGSGVKDETRGQQTDHLNDGDSGERHKAEGTQASISEGREKERGGEVGTDYVNGRDSKMKSEGEDGGQTDHLCRGDSKEKSKAEGEEKSGGRNLKKAVSPPTSVVTPPPRQPKNLKVCG